MGDDWDKDFGPRPRGRAGATVGSRWPIVAVLGVLVAALAAWVIYAHATRTPEKCGAGPSVACDFADQITISGYRQTTRTVSGGRAEVIVYAVGPPTTDYLALISGPGLTLSPPREPDTAKKAAVIGVGGSTDPRYKSCAVLVYLVRTPDTGSANGADRDSVRRGELAMLRVGLVCERS